MVAPMASEVSATLSALFPVHKVVVSRPIVPSQSKITDPEELAHYWTVFLDLWGVRDARRRRSATFHPTCNPCSVSRRTMETLANNPYLITLKSDGVRYTLMLTTRKDTVDGAVALFVDRARNMYEVEVCAPDEHFLKGTLIEGELVWPSPQKAALTFYSFDVACVKGQKIQHWPFVDRHRTCVALTTMSDELRNAPDADARIMETDSVVVVHYSPEVHMRPKRFVGMEHAERLWNDRTEAGHRVDGLILQSANAPYKSGAALDASCLKWKEHSSIDLSGPIEDLRTATQALPKTVRGRAITCLQSRVKGGLKRTSTDIVEYMISVTDTAIFIMPMRVRWDKSRANSTDVVLATIDDILEHVTPADMAAVAQVNMDVDPDTTTSE